MHLLVIRSNLCILIVYCLFSITRYIFEFNFQFKDFERYLYEYQYQFNINIDRSSVFLNLDLLLYFDYAR